MRPRALTPLRRLAAVRPTARGGGLLGAGGVLAAVGVVLDLPDLVGLGAAGVLVVLVAWASLAWQHLDSGRGALDVTRSVDPHPVVAGSTATTALRVAVRHRTGAAFERLARLRLSEQAAHELAGTTGIRAHVRSAPDRIDVTYQLTPVRRGRWGLGPVLTTRTDVFGLVRTTQPLGVTTRVAVWPRTTALSVRAPALGDLDRAATGARLSATDDTVLREYVAGDDPRRVHWAASARQGHLIVRADEGAGFRPVTVLLDRALLAPAPEDRPGARPASHQAVEDGEWAVSLAASVAVSFLEAGHPTRLVATTTAPERTEHTAGARAGRARLLDATVDLTGIGGDAVRALTRTVQVVRAGRSQSEITVAVVGPLDQAGRHALASLGADGVCWAVLVVPRGTGMRHDVTPTADALRAAGWRVATCPPGTDPSLAWSALTGRVA
ncbi:uncharacterized protein (DUF58 family) [Isoptericola jiangsuensis]|uniref:Uncharacterized protein (DUF58 family) n=1 Tax=Isoptericola jiangsuensis TaxID=548579 RepID=A0A2A9EX41_9MICO|nr:DUF58 domain-containing protein [Isoptericola jiangsuensis]PFG42840.1 uncharacterized protein (DUF58 family) [Isoptericola jiangsuensis]